MYPVIDLHCDLLSYLEATEGSTHMDTEGIGCALPHLQAGGVKLQVCALYCPTEPGSAGLATVQRLRDTGQLLSVAPNWWRERTHR